MNNGSYTVQELMIARISREIRDKETVGVGALSPLPAAAALLARELQAPGLTLAIFGSEEWPFREGTKEFFDLAQRGGCDLFFLSGAQIDHSASINLHFIGSYKKPRVRLPGGAGAAMMYCMAGRVILFTNRHDPKVLVEKVDFVSAAARSEPGFFRRGTADRLITPMCVMKYNPGPGRLSLESIHPGISLEKLQQETGFDLGKETVPATEEPSPAELKTLRTKVRVKLLSMYPLFAGRYIKK